MRNEHHTTHPMIQQMITTIVIALLKSLVGGVICS
jgi:hypothetical protein